MTKNLNLYLAGVLAVGIAGTMLYRSIEESFNPTGFEEVEWCSKETRGRTQDNFYSDFAEKYNIPKNSVTKNRFVKELVYHNGSNLKKENLMLPCNLD